MDINETNPIKALMTALVADAKAAKAQRDMHNLDYKHAMKKLKLLAEGNPVEARELGITTEETETAESPAGDAESPAGDTDVAISATGRKGRKPAAI